MANVQSSIRYISRNGTNSGIRITPRDQTRIALLGRWYCLTVNHLIRAESHPRLWSPLHPEYGTEDSREEARRAFHTIHHRLNKLRRIEYEPSRNLGPAVGADMSPDGRTAWFATRIGATIAQLPWTMRNSINPLFAQHSWMAADIGMSLEEAGYTVLSERELATGTDKNGYTLTAPLESDYVSPKGRITSKKPDIAVLSPDGSSYIAIEVERDTDRSIKTYEHKLRAYRRNTAITAVWYVCSSATTANRVAKGAEAALGRDTSFPIRIATRPPRDGVHTFDMDNLPAPLARDLEKADTGQGITV